MTRQVLCGCASAIFVGVVLSGCAHTMGADLDVVSVAVATAGPKQVSPNEGIAVSISEKQGWPIESVRALLRAEKAFTKHETPSQADLTLLSQEAPKHMGMMEDLASGFAKSPDPTISAEGQAWATSLIRQTDDKYACLIGYRALKRIHSPEVDTWRATLLQRDSGFFTKELDDIDRKVG